MGFTPALYVGMAPERLGHEFSSDEEKSAKVKAMREKFTAEELPKFLGYYSTFLKASGAFFCGDKMTIADLAILPQLRYFQKGVADYIPSDCLNGFPEVLAWIERMMADPKIKA